MNALLERYPWLDSVIQGLYLITVLYERGHTVGAKFLGIC
jgi:hypothetical protein